MYVIVISAKLASTSHEQKILNFKMVLPNKFITNTGLLLMLGGEDAFNKIESSS